jgi:hypothetical protein
MNNAKAALSESQSRRQPVQPKSSSKATSARPDDEIRDFFKRGDRGQYEGGVGTPSIPTWDLPEERPKAIVRTPRQQARRVAMMQVVGTIVAACLVLLVTAARLKASNGSETQAVNARHADARPAALSPVKPSPQYSQQSKAELAPPPAPAAAPNAPPTVAAANEVPTPAKAPAAVQELPAPAMAAPVAPREVAVAPSPSPASVSVPAGSKVAAAAKVSHTAAKVAPTSVARAKPAQYAEPIRPPTAAPTTHAATPKRAVAAFPDD